MNDQQRLQTDQVALATRRHFFGRTGSALSCWALANLLQPNSVVAASSDNHSPNDERLGVAPPGLRPASAKRMIYIHLAGSPPQHETFDYKPELAKLDGQDAPDSLWAGQTFAFIKGVPKMLGPRYSFAQYGESGTWVSDQLPHLAKHVDKMLVVKSMRTTQFNHAPAQLLALTGQPRFGYPSLGAWITYGLGSENENLPGFVVLMSGGQLPSSGKNAWGAGFLPSMYQGVQCQTTGDPVLHLSDPAGMTRETRRRSLDALQQLNQLHHEVVGDAETLSRIQQFELAYRMQMEAPRVMDIRHESAQTLADYGAMPGTASFANNCLLARRLVENGVRFVNLFDWGWDVHGTGPNDDLITKFPQKCRETDRPIAALLSDLEQRGLLDETMVVWTGEFGRTAMNEARGGSKFLGRDHHPGCFSMWMAGGGIRGGRTYGETDDFANSVVEKPVTPHDMQATLLHALGVDPHRFSYPHQGLAARLIGPTEEARIIHDWLL